MKEESDIKKLITDFIRYSEVNLTWFNMNFILTFTPLIIVFYIAPIYEHEMIDEDAVYKGLAYKWIIGLQWLCHVIQFATKTGIYFD